MEEKIETSVQLEMIMREGYLDLAKARYIRGKESIGVLQIPSEDSETKSLFDLETAIDDEGKATFDLATKKDGEVQNPLKWFGVLVPQNLKCAQKRFQESLLCSVKLANLQSEINCNARKIDGLNKLKSELIVREE